MLSALWVASTAQLLLIGHHLAVDGVSWRILLEDFNLAWVQHRGGQPVVLPAPGTSFAGWAALLAEHAYHPDVVNQAERWRQIAAVPAALPAVRPELDTYANAGSLSVELDVETTRMLLGEVPAAFHAGINDILLIAFGLALTEFLGTAGSPVVIDAEGHGRDEELAGDVEAVDLSRTVGWFTTKYPVSLAVGGLDWGQVLAGDPDLGSIIKDAKEQLRTTPDGLTYGLLRYLNDDVDLEGADPTIGFNYLGRMSPTAAEVSGEMWRFCWDGLPNINPNEMLAMPLAHTWSSMPARWKPIAGPRLRAGWMWATSALDHAQVDRLSGLWFDALAGICALVRGGGGGLTPSDIAPARLTQQQIDELCQSHEVADVLPLTPLQQGLLFHAESRTVLATMCTRCRLDADAERSARSRPVARCGASRGVPASQFGGPVLSTGSTSRCRVLSPIPRLPWRYVELDADDGDVDEQIAQVCAAERAAVCDLAEQSPIRAALIRTAPDQHRFVLTNHHIVLDGWSLPILLGEVFAGYHGQRLPAAVPYRRFVSWLADRDLDAARAAWGEVLAGFDTPTLVGPRPRWRGRARRRLASGVGADHPGVR